MVEQKLRSDVTKFHKGVYAIIKNDNQILLIKKARGPYTGLYDLPGGSPEAGETPEQTLIREVKEETNCDVEEYTFLEEKTIVFSNFTKASGKTGVLQHTGVLFVAQVTGLPTEQGDGLDSNGAIWMPLNQLSSDNATPFALYAKDI